MEGLAGAASAFAVVQLADRILTLCGSYALAVKDAKTDIERLGTEVESLQSVLKRVSEVVENDATKLYASQSAMRQMEKIIKSCQSTLVELEDKLDPKKGKKGMSRFGLRAMKWPFKRDEVTNIIDSLNRHKGTVALALNVDQR